jgi:hypothetical protein
MQKCKNKFKNKIINLKIIKFPVESINIGFSSTYPNLKPSHTGFIILRAIAVRIKLYVGVYPNIEVFVK